MDDGLEVGITEFKRMKSIDRDILMYNNLIHIRKKLGDYKLHKKIQYVWLTLLTIFVGLKKYLGI